MYTYTINNHQSTKSNKHFQIKHHFLYMCAKPTQTQTKGLPTTHGIKFLYYLISSPLT